MGTLAWNHIPQETMAGIHGHPQLCSKFKVNLQYIRSGLRQQNKRMTAAKRNEGKLH